jgi:hypothetical protein
VDKLGDDDGQIVKGDDSGLVDSGQNDSGFLADEELEIGNDFVQDDSDSPKDRRNLVDGQVIRTETLCQRVVVNIRYRRQC